MHDYSPSFKLGVLNMTICFDRPRPPKRVEQRMQAHKLKISQLSGLVPKFKQPIYKSHTVVYPKDEPHSPYQSYIRHHKQSIRYFRQQSQSFKKSNYILGFNPQSNKTIQLEFNQPFEEESVKKTNKNNKDNHLRLVFNKRHIKNRYEVEDKQPKTERITIDLEKNPEESLKSIFTVRPVRTSIRSNRNNPEKSSQVAPRPAITRKEPRNNSCNIKQRLAVDFTDKKIRPWSPVRSPFNKQAILQSTILQPNYPA